MGEQYFTAEPGSSDERRAVEFGMHGRLYRLEASTGVFSGDRLDPGTSVLLRYAPLPAAPGTFLDLGCGYGPIACVLATNVPGAEIWAVDVNARALELSRTNAESLGVADTVRVVRPDEVPADLAFDQIWSNPPVRIGKAALHELLGRWLPRLAEHGIAWLVVGKHLGADSLQRWLQAEGWRADRHASAKSFRVLRVSH